MNTYDRGLAQPVDRGGATMLDALIGLDEVTKRYDGDAAPAVEGVGMQIAPGESVAVMGPSGSGKSTLLNMIAGLDRPTSGTVTVAGERIDRLSETGLARFRRRQVGMIFQFFNLLDDMTVLDNILLPAQLAGMPAVEARARHHRPRGVTPYTAGMTAGPPEPARLARQADAQAAAGFVPSSHG